MERCSGVLMPVFSIPSKYGIGDFGRGSYEFIDFLSRSGQKVWQILPLVQTGYGNSPYSSISSTSFNPYFISPELLKEQGLITSNELKFSLSDKKYIDYGEVHAVRFPLLRSAFNRFDKTGKEFIKYVRSREAYDYALFMAIKFASGQKHFYHWEDGLKYRDKKALDKFSKAYKEEITFWQFVQFIAKNQWLDLKKYANKKGIKIMGDMPLYVALDSVDVWVNPHLYKIDQYFTPKKVAAVPPDYFSKEGQLWGNPVYDYKKHQEEGFSWWINRIKKVLKVYDYVRIDHFRGLDRYYQVDYGKANAMEGEWVKVPSIELFDAIHKEIDKDKIIAEDLGIIDDGVRDLLKHTGYPGMKILSFAFNGDPNNLYLPENVEENSVCYTGTHDNDTLLGLIEGLDDWDYNNLINGVKSSMVALGVDGDVSTSAGLVKVITKLGFRSRSNMFIIPVQDILMKGADYRINEPGTVKDTNWAIRIDKKELNNKTAKYLMNLTKKYHR